MKEKILRLISILGCTFALSGVILHHYDIPVWDKFELLGAVFFAIRGAHKIIHLWLD